ncbi:MAG: ABC transporter permease [[Clostridium] scindens]
MDKTKLKSRCYLVILLAVFIAAWQVLADRGMINPLFFSSPKQVLADMAEMFSTGYIMPHIGITLYAAFLGLFYGIVLGTAIALIVGNNRVLAHILEPIFVGIHGLPLLALGPLFVVWFGIGIKSKIFMATISVFFLVFFNIYAGFKDVDIQLIQTLKLMRASKDQAMTKVILPSCIPWLIASLKAGVGAAVLGAIVGEYLGATAGLGWVIQSAGGYYNITRVIACVIVLMVIMFILNAIVSWIDRKALKWRPSINK